VPVFLLWPTHAGRDSPRRSGRERALTTLAVVVFLASIASGAAAFLSDIDVAFRYAGASVFSPGDRSQIEAVRGVTPPGEAILLTVGRNGQWASLLWQRALYPERPIIVLSAPLREDVLSEARRRYGFRTAVAIGDPPPDPGFRESRDLGPIPGLPGRVRFGTLSP